MYIPIGVNGEITDFFPREIEFVYLPAEQIVYKFC